MRNHFTSTIFFSFLCLLLTIGLFFTAGSINRLNAQCSVAIYSTVAATPTCTSQSLRGTGSSGLGAGESQNVPLTSGIYYTFTFNANGNGQCSGMCINGTNVTSTPYVYHYTGTTGNVAIGMYRANTTWTATSASLTYQITTPSETTAGAGTFCTTDNVTCSPTNGTSYWQSTTSGQQSTTTSATSEAVTTVGTNTYYYNTDNGGCWSGTSGQAVTIDAASTAPTSISTSATNTCSGSGVTLTEVGGALGTSASYQWGTGSTIGTSPVSGATSSSYTPSPTATTTYWVSVTEGSPCGGVSNTGAVKTISVFGQPSFSTSPASPSICAGSSTSLTVALSGGISLSYQWQYYNGSSWGSVVTGTPAGVTYTNATSATMTIATSTPTTPPAGYQYRCVVSDAGSGCNSATSNPGTVTVNGIPLAPTVASSVTGCGQAVINAVYGTYGNTCRFYGPNSTTTLAGSGTSFAISAVGSYTYYVTSYNSSTGCESAQTTVAVTVNTSFSVTSITNPLYSTYHSNDVSCYGGSNAEVQVVVTSTNYPISYQWSNGVSFSLSSGTNTLKGSSSSTSTASLPLGNYQVTITDNGGCVTITNYTASTEPAQLLPSLSTPTAYSYYGFGENCSGASSGGLTVSSTGGYTPSYSYGWSGPTSITANNTAPTGLAAGTYTVTVTDGNSCTATTSATISQPSAITFSINIGYACSGSSYTSASITVLAAGGASGTYQYSMNGGSTWQSSNIFSGLAGGASYNIEVRDNVYNSCVSGTQSGTITLPSSGTSIGNCNFIYVTTSGDPAGTLGTQNCPVSLTQAFAIYASNSSRSQILVQTGSYSFNSTISIPAGITIDGGYDANWIKNTNDATTFNISPAISNNGSVGYYMGMQATGNSFTLKDLTVNVQTAGASGTYNSSGLTVYGLYISGQTGITLSRCTINTGAGSSGSGGVYSATAGGGDNGGAGSDPYYLSDYDGYTYYYVGQSTWNGGCTASSPGGQSGSAGTCYTCTSGYGYGGAGGAGSTSGGCNIFGCDASGSNGGNGGNGYTGASAAAYPAPSGAGTSGLNAYYAPEDGSTGYVGDGGGGGGSGGAGSPGTCCSCTCGGGQAYGGGGGSGGAGGAGGQGGYGGGGSFAVYAWGGSATIVDCSLNPGTGGTGGAGASGHPGVGGSGGFGGLCHGGCDGGCGGNGGTGGTGGTGGQGQTGYTGVSAETEALNSASLTVSSTGTANTVPSNGITSANWISGCTNSQINLTKTSANSWGSFIGSDAQFVDNLTNSSTSYTSSANNVYIYYPSTSTLGAKNLTVGSTTLSNFIVLKGNRNVSPVPTGPLPIIAAITAPCPSSNLSVSLDASFTSTMQANETGWSWSYAEISPTNNSASPTAINTSANPYGTPATVAPPTGGWVPGATYQVSMTMDEQCCGWSIPVYTTFTIPVALATPAIASGSTTQCANSSATYTINAVSGATYTWTVSGGTFAVNSNTTVTGTSSLSEAVNWGGYGTGTVSVVSLNSCGTASSPVSWTVTILKNPTPSISPVPSTASICLGNSIALNGNSTAGTGGNSTFTYAWSNGTDYWGGSSFSSGSPSFSASYNDITVTPSPAGTYTYSIIVTEGGSGCTASVSQSVTVDPVLTAGISGGNTPICYNTSPGTFTATAGGGNGTYTYQWYNSSGAIGGANSSTYTAPVLTANNLYYCAVSTGGGCSSVNTGTTNIVVDGNLSATQSGGSTPVCYNTSPGTFTATASGGTGSYTYLWYINAVSGSVTTSTYAPGNLTATSTIYCSVTSGSCGSYNTTPVTITVYPNLTAAISGGTSPVCYNSDPGAFTATAGGGSGTYSYQWYNSSGAIGSATSSTYDPGDITASNAYSCTVTSAGCTAVSTGSAPVTAEPAVSNYGNVAATGGLTQTVCDNVAPNGGNALTVSGAAGSSGSFTYQWYYQTGLVAAPSGGSTAGWTACGSSQGTGYNTASFIAAGGGVNITYACFVTPAAPVCSGQWATNDVQVTVLSSGPTESSSGGASVCLNASVTLSSTLSVVIPATYQWYSSTSVGFTSPVTISGANSTTYSPSTSTAGTMYYEIIATFTGSGCSPATSNPQTVVVYTAPSAAISGGTSPVCYNTSPGTFTATGSGGSGTYSYQWYNSSGAIGSATTSTYTAPALTASNSYYCSVTDVAGCGTVSTLTTAITVDVNLGGTVSGGISPICYNTSPGTFTATASGGTGTYTYQWYNGAGLVPGQVASTYAPGNLTASNSYFCAITSGTCGTFNTTVVNITVHANLTASISGGNSPICYNTAPGTIRVLATGGTGSYTYQWYNNEGSITGAASSTYAPGNLTASDAYYCSVTSGTCGSTTTSTVSITVDGILAAGITGGATPICYNTDPGAFTATASGGTGTYTYEWFNSSGSVSGQTSSTYDPGNLLATNAYYCSVTSGTCGTVATGTTNITVDATLTAGITGGSSPLCYNAAPGTFTATGGGGTGSYTYQWYNSSGAVGGSTASTYAPGNLSASNAYYCAVSSGSCGVINTSTTNITVYGIVAASISGGTSPICYNTSPGSLTATATGGAGSYSYQWYNSSGSVPGSVSSTYAPGNLMGSNTYYCSVTDASCGSANTLTTAITVDANLTAVISGGVSPLCYNSAPGTFTATVSGGTGTYVYQWYNNEGSVSGAGASTYAPGNLTASDAYYCAVSSGSCGTVNTLTTDITVYGNLQAVISGGASPVCYNTAPGTFTASASGGAGTYSYQWYNSSGLIGGAFNSTYAPGNLTASNSYYCSVTDGSCGTANTLTTSITVDGSLAVSINSGTTPLCYNTSPGIFTATGSGGGGSFSYTYQWYNSAGLISGATASTYNPGNLTASNSYYCVITSGSCGNSNSNTAAITVSPELAAITATVSTNPVCITATGGGTDIQVANTSSGVNYQLQTSLGANVGSAVAGNGGNINLPTGSMAATTIYQVMATDIVSGCTYNTPADITVVALDPDISIGAQISGQHFTFGTIGSPALPAGWSAPNNANSNSWELETANPASSGSYSYYNSSGTSSSASTGAYIETPSNTTATTPDVDLVSPVINVAGYSNISVQWGAQKSAGYTGTVNLYYSVDGGTTWSSAVTYTDVPANLTGTPWSLVNNTVQVKLPSAVDNQSNLMLKWSANPSTDGSYYSMNDIGVYGLGKIINCAGNSITLPYVNSSCSVNKYSISADATNPWPSSPAFSYISNANIPGSPISIPVPSATASGTYNLDLTVNDGAGHSSGTISFPVTTDLLMTAAVGLDNCSCNYTTSGGIGNAYGNIVTVYAAGGAGGFYFNSAGVVDTLLSTIDGSGTAYPGTDNQAGVKGVFWSKADGATHNYTISDGYCSVTGTQITQVTIPSAIPFGSATGQPTAITTGNGGGNGISGSFNNAGYGDPAITNVNGNALTCHQTADFGNKWVTYQVNNLNSSGLPVAGDTTNNKAVVEINDNGNNLDSVQVSVYRDASLPVVPNAATTTTACYQYPGYGMERHFMIKSTKSTGTDVFSNNPVGVRLYFTDAEFQDLAYWTMSAATNASGESAGCAYLDTVTNLNSIFVTKYTGTNEDGSYSNNSPSGLYRLFGKNLINAGDGPLTVDAGGATLTTGGNTNLHYVQMNVTEFSEFWLGGSSGGEALPVQMIYLEAEAMNNDSIQVRWGTATEVNNHEFDVERSTDGNTWSTIGVVAGHDNSVVEEDYAYNDLNVVPGVNYYYRLKQVDNNGNYQYTGIVQAEINGVGAFAVMNFIPNPTSGSTQLTVTTTKAQEITVDFYDMLGQKVLSSVQELQTGTNRIDFDLHQFAVGTYSAVVTSENQLYTKKIVVTR